MKTPAEGSGNSCPVIDGHSHMWQGFQSLKGLEAKEEDLRGTRKTSIQQLPSDPRELATELRRLGVIKVVTFAQEMTRVRGQWLGSNQLAVDLQKHWPEVVVAVAAGEPLDEQDRFNAARFREAEAALRDHHLYGLLFTPPYGHFYSNDVRAYPFYQLAEQLGAFR